MIEVVVKRDGSKEPFEAKKLNKWAEWASESCGNYVDWSSVVFTTVATLPRECSSEELQKRLIQVCIENDSWSYYKMAGRLLTVLLEKKIFPNGKPTIKELHNQLINIGLMVKLDYTDEEYQRLEKIINHNHDYKSSYFEVDFINGKYALKDRVQNKVYETQQFVYMRMAMALAEDECCKVEEAVEWYKLFSEKVINAPSPNYTNLGTPLRGFSSCCVYTTEDTAAGLAVGDHIAYTMTYMSSGIGAHVKTRSLGDPVRNGAISHNGKLPYYKALAASVQANMQASRGGACTTYFTVYDPEIKTLLQLRNIKNTEDKKIRSMHYSMGTNKFFARAAGRDEDIWLFSYYDVPDLYEAQYSKDPDEFERLYNKYIKQKGLFKEKVRARDLIISSLSEAYETGTAYLNWTDEINRHTPFKDTIYSANLCLEAIFVTKGYKSMQELYSDKFIHSEDGLGEQEPEIGLCSLAAINVANIKNDEHYAKACYYALKMINKCIYKNKYVFPHLELTAKARMNAGVGIVGLAHHMAKNKMFYSSQEGKNFLHKTAETHMWHLINASLRLGKEQGNAPWMERTLWPEGWLPIDTYCKAVDGVVTVGLERDWEDLRKQVIANKGIANSVVCNFMPSESSSKASGTTNGLYPIRGLTLIKSDAEVVTDWAAPDGEKLKKWYELAWDVETKDMIDVYAIFQKFCDQGISADLYDKLVGDSVVGTDKMLKDYLYMTKMGQKTRYYQNTKTSDGTELNIEEACVGGVCKL